MDIGSGALTFSANAVVPNKHFTTTYATVNVYNTRGSVVYRQSIKGSSQLGDYVDTAIWMRAIPLKSSMPKREIVPLLLIRSMAIAGNNPIPSPGK